MAVALRAVLWVAAAVPPTVMVALSLRFEALPGAAVVAAALRAAVAPPVVAAA